MSRPRVAVTMGDPAGVGPELLLRVCSSPAVRRVCEPVAVASRAVLERVSTTLRLPLPADIADPLPAGFDPNRVVAGLCDANSGLAAGACIDLAISGYKENRWGSVATNPISKSAINAAGFGFPGHTEWFAQRLGVTGEMMMMWHPRMSVVLVTCHRPMSTIFSELTPERITAAGVMLAASLRRLLRRTPRIAVLGLNPHAGESGLLGPEDQERVLPAVEALRKAGIDADGPLPADTAFAPHLRKRYDGWVALYHDQGLIPFKTLYFDTGVNVTLGLPMVRTSVDHGTAADIAWRGLAKATSLSAAVRLAAHLAS